MTTLVWFRDDLRIADHPALWNAAADQEGLVCLYVLDEESEGVRPLGGAAKWWLHHSLVSLRTDIESLGGRLVLRRGRAEDIVPQVAQEAGATRIVWNRRYSAPERAIDTALKSQLPTMGVEVHTYSASLLFEPWTIATKTGTHYKVFTPFWRTCLSAPPPRLPLPAPTKLVAPEPDLPSDDLRSWDLLPTAPDWSTGFVEHWIPGETGGLQRLTTFLNESISEYDRARDIPGLDGTSRLSPHLRWGEISPHTVWHSAHELGKSADKFLSELGWREFAWHTLYHNPDLATQNLDSRFDGFPWPPLDQQALAAWQQGETGVPLVDAGMRELWHTGTMHNRVRMVTASFLVKNLLINWRHGEQWFWDTLVDADLASNPFNWQWVAGCGADAAPYFRIFNPITQQQKFDPHNLYVDRWNRAGTASEPIVDLRASRQHALAAFTEIKTPLIRD